MTPAEIACVDQEQREATDQANQQWHIQGITDAAFGELPRYTIQAYLNGYVEGTTRLPVKPDGTINREPQTQPMFLYGPDGERIRGVDPGDCHWLYEGEF